MSDKNWGAIFDFDGVIVDTEWHHEVCWNAVAKERNQPITHEQYVAGFGVKNARFISEILKWTDRPVEIAAIAKRKEEIFQEHAKHNEIHILPGLERFLEELHKHNIPCAIASSSILENIEIILQDRPIRRYFSAIVSGEDVKEGKPDPEVFLTAAKRLQTAPRRSVVFEDALLGVEAASRAGCLSVAITTTFSKEAFSALPYRSEMIVKTFEELSYDKVHALFAKN